MSSHAHYNLNFNIENLNAYMYNRLHKHEIVMINEQAINRIIPRHLWQLMKLTIFIFDFKHD